MRLMYYDRFMGTSLDTPTRLIDVLRLVRGERMWKNGIGHESSLTKRRFGHCLQMVTKKESQKECSLLQTACLPKRSNKQTSHVRRSCPFRFRHNSTKQPRMLWKRTVNSSASCHLSVRISSANLNSSGLLLMEAEASICCAKSKNSRSERNP